MTPEAQRIAIAEAMKLRHKMIDGEVYISRVVNHKRTDWLPFDPLNDLNAMNEAEKVLTKDQMFAYALILSDNVLDLSDDWITYTMSQVIHATAAQRSEAFLKCLGLWKD